MTTLLYSHESSLLHEVPPGHPERPDRLRAVEKILSEDRFKKLVRKTPAHVTREQVLRVHPADYYDAIERAIPEEGDLARIDGDTALSHGSWEPIVRAAGGACQAVDEVMQGKANNAFVAMRPPGHHAETVTAMGFCFFNNAAIAARHARAKHGAERVAIIDFDVHHGNGSQEIFWNDPTVMYCSTHQMPLYPGTGAKNETGAKNTVVNAPLSSGDNGTKFREAVESRILPRLNDFRPDLVIISAGFDAHTRDPLANINLVETDFAWVTQKLMDVADKHAKGRVVSVLEGGYDLQGLALSTAAHVTELMKAG